MKNKESNLNIYNLPNGKKVQFLNAKQGCEEILKDELEPFFSLLTRIDIEARMGKRLSSNQIQNLAQFKNFLLQSVVEFTEEEISLILEMVKNVQQLIDLEFPDFIPKLWKFIKTSGAEEGGAFYTRNDNIVLPAKRLREILEKDISKLNRAIIHETFHVYSRLNRSKRLRLYKTIGFREVGHIRLGNYLTERRITNPDAPSYNYLIQVKAQDRTIEVVPIVFSPLKTLPKKNNRNFFDNVKLGLFEVYKMNSDYEILNGDKKPTLISPTEVYGYYERFGQNTSYIIHPEEILADNFVLLILLRASQVEGDYDMDILKSIERVIKE